MAMWNVYRYGKRVAAQLSLRDALALLRDAKVGATTMIKSHLDL